MAPQQVQSAPPSSPQTADGRKSSGAPCKPANCTPQPQHTPSSPKTPHSVTYSDRFIPSRAEGARLNYSVLERETAAESTAQRDDREVPKSMLVPCCCCVLF